MKISTIVLAIAAAVSAQDTVSATASDACEPHGDHWHCPSGVAEPTFAPSAAAAITSPVSGSITSAPAASASHSHDDHDEDDHDHDHAATASTCEPHGDHWHCPSGVAEPTTAPSQTLSTASGAAASTSPAQATGAASAVSAGRQGVLAVVVGAVGAFFL
ncbi:hypothetical protein B5807_06705 [Epicoccum nigrum]|uniref:Uncharacterized protein n=1 Tax=Epicoccum nigrum TaxID=105696 RepID=A0A1Y2LXQ5_EPING|nr:hypothetical protein B5807_06705 [Epicoccum nigrum]